MKENRWRATLSALLLMTASTLARAEVVTFAGHLTDHLDLAGPQVEGSFTYTATGAGWEIQPDYGNPPVALVTFYNGEPALAGDTVEFKRTDGGKFSFNSVDYRTVLDGGSDQVEITGLLLGNPAGSLALTSSTTTFQTVAAGFGPLDLLRVRVTSAGNNAAVFDNFNLVPVPEPGTLVIGIPGGLMILGLARRQQRRKAA